MVVDKKTDQIDPTGSPDLHFNILPRENTLNSSSITPIVQPSSSSKKPEKPKFGDKLRSIFSKNKELEKQTNVSASRRSITVKDQIVIDADDAGYNSDSDKTHHNKSKSEDYADIPDVEEEDGLDSKSSSKMSKTELNVTASRISMGKCFLFILKS